MVSSFNTPAAAFLLTEALNGGPTRCSVHEYARQHADELCADKWGPHPVITANASADHPSSFNSLHLCEAP